MGHLGVDFPVYRLLPRLLPAVAAIAMWLAFGWLARRSAFHPLRFPQGRWGDQAALGAQDVWLHSGGYRLHAWWVVVPGATTATLFLHGNAGNLSHRSYAIQAVTSIGSSILVPDYRGYGKSEGSPTEDGLYQDAQAAYDWIRGRGFRRVVVHGESLGSAVAVDLASRRQVDGLILEAPFSRGRDMAALVLPVLGPLLFHGWDSERKIGAVRAPVLILHGTRDGVVPFALGEQLFQAAREPKSFWRAQGAGHNDLAAQPGYRETLADFHRSLDEP